MNSKLLIYFENAAGRLLEHPDGYVRFEYFPGKRKLTDLQALLTHTGQLLKRNNWNKLLGDQRLMTPFTPEESAWIVDYWLDRARQRPGGIYGAVILANDVFARLSMTQVMTDAKAAALTYRLFDSEEKAVEWLKQLA
ncbi:hypothetical protein GCM10023172_43070 [Hymenobacter ginsengisoli]|uniref:STAS/SEC14 domain-containing protein n=1 Tax=Hymenobacter ginsengisoli TaxID=1051626 RepID=A0ABP8QS72_9BACT|nr:MULTISPECIES: hypothetical protein [unclassified Hymenobacter]MBO2033461.1 hypothetical protein [Hymenobacter sp. BT559]